MGRHFFKSQASGDDSRFLTLNRIAQGALAFEERPIRREPAF
jgi:hypothetical protein